MEPGRRAGFMCAHVCMWVFRGVYVCFNEKVFQHRLLLCVSWNVPGGFYCLRDNGQLQFSKGICLSVFVSTVMWFNSHDIDLHRIAQVRKSEASILFPFLPTISYVTLDRSLYLSEPHFSLIIKYAALIRWTLLFSSSSEIVRFWNE